MQISQLEVGSPIYIALKQLGTGYSPEYPCQIADITGENELLISSPVYRNNYIVINVDTHVRVTFTHESGLFIFEGMCHEIVNQNGLVFYKIRMTSDIERLQRREHFRVNVNSQVIFKYTKDNKESFGQGVIIDISGGGLKFTSFEELPVGEKINIYLSLNTNKEFSTIARIIRCIKVDVRKYEVCLKFDNLEFRQRELLIKYIFDIQRELLKEGKQKA